MDIETLLSIAKQQLWWDRFARKTKRRSITQLAQDAIKGNNYMEFISMAFVWSESEEGFDYWYEAARDLIKAVKDYEKSIPTFKMEEPKILVARFINCIDRQPGDSERFKDLAAKTLQENNIAFDLLITEGSEIKAYRRGTSFKRIQ